MQRNPGDYGRAVDGPTDDPRYYAYWSTKQPEYSANPVSYQQRPDNYAHGDSATVTDDHNLQTVKEFVSRYYRTLSQAPEDAWRHFTVTAQYAHVDGELNAAGHGVRPAVGQQQIHATIVYQRFAECRFCVTTVHAQRTAAGDYVVLVVGTVRRNCRPPWPFVQTFVVCHVATINQWAISNTMLYTRHE